MSMDDDSIGMEGITQHTFYSNEPRHSSSSEDRKPTSTAMLKAQNICVSVIMGIRGAQGTLQWLRNEITCGNGITLQPI
jgi:hypothetical protein